MKIEKKFVSIKTYTLTEEEANVVKVCLQYCYHRLTSHNNKGIHKMTTYKDVGALLDSFVI